MTDLDYRAAICARVGAGEGLSMKTDISFREVSIGEWRPGYATCHANVDRWVGAHPHCIAVRGWMRTAGLSDGGCIMAAHSIVKDTGDGSLFDITPFCDQNARDYVVFITHDGSDEAFFQVEATNKSFNCPGGLTAPATLEDWRPFDGDDASPDGDNFGDMPDYDR